MPSAVLKTKLGMRVLDVGGSAAGDRSGAFIPISDIEPTRATFGGFSGSFTPAALATDVFQLIGSATKLIRLKAIYISGTSTTASNIIVNIILRTAANTGGTAVAITPGRHDSNDDAVSATLQSFSANPSGLGAGATIRGGRLNLAPAANGAIDRLLFDWSWHNDKSPILQSAAQSVVVNLGGAAVPVGASLDISCEWTEEALETVL
ncbi:hypothetical protein UFOVP68_10 [uncultured Caudovirales phage]|uniref:Uncharacterized protein n=1 Tax=uncultured Caudovirales phage TaxID=2100421 RepID=A0A6J5KYR5_9CAUD|nr:hypothetical protein UFOVP68_10 [uncultured Caudovirales phage]